MSHPDPDSEVEYLAEQVQPLSTSVGVVGFLALVIGLVLGWAANDFTRPSWSNHGHAHATDKP